MSGQNLNARNPYGNPVKTTQQNKRPLKNPFANIQVSQDDADNDFQTLNFSGNADYQQNTLQSPFDPRNQENTYQTRPAFGQPSNNNQNNRKQPFGSSVENTGGLVRRDSGAGRGDQQRDQGGAQNSNMYPGQMNQQSRINNQEPYYNNSFMSSLSGINNFFGGQPQQAKPEQGGQVYDEDNEPPLLEDLGIDLELIKVRTLAVLRFRELDERFAKDADMSGPLLIALAFGALMLLRGKVTFGYIYGFGSIGTIAVYMIMNLLSQSSRAKLYNTCSILGYCLIPIVLLSVVNVVLDLVTWYGFILCTGTVVWATVAATKFFVVLLHLQHQKFLVGYPVLLFYIVFVLITIF